MSLSFILLFYAVLPTSYFEAEARCPNGYHKDESGECEKVTDNKGKPRCPDGYHRSPDGDCEKVDDSSNDNDDDEDDDKEKSTSKKTDNEPKNSNNCEGSADCFEGRVTEVVDGDTIDINTVRIRLSLINTPETDEPGYDEAKEFAESTCGVGSWARVDEDDGQRGGSYDRIIGLVYCKNSDTSLNEKIIRAGHAEILREFCDISEFSAEPWASSSCRVQNNDNENILPDKSPRTIDPFFDKQEQEEASSYSNSELGISLAHPHDWKFGSLKNGIQFIKEKNAVYVEIRKHNLDSSNEDLEKYVSDYIKDRSNSREDFKLLELTKTTISGDLPAYKAIYTFLKTEDQKDFGSEQTTNKILRMWTFGQQNAYLVAYVADEDKYDLYLPIAEKIIDTMEINPGIQQSFSNNGPEDNDENDDSKDNDSNSNEGNDSKDNDSNEGNDSEDENDGGDKNCSDFDKKNFKVQPGDPYGLDRDGDGIACEG